MRKTYAGVLIAFLGLTQAIQAETTSQTAVFQFTFRDSTRGTIVRPEAVLVDDKVVFHSIDEAGRMIVPVTPGDHKVVVKARGYNDLESRQTALGDHTPNNVMMLDPSETPRQLRPENIGQGMPANGTVIAGFVVDGQTGRPLPSADVGLIGKSVKVATDEDGFFKLPVEMPDGKQMPEDPRGTLFAQRDFRVVKPGYGFEERLNVLVESGAPKIFQFEMVRGGGGNVADEAAGRNNLQSSLFGLTNVEPEDPPTSVTMPTVPPGHEGHSH